MCWMNVCVWLCARLRHTSLCWLYWSRHITVDPFKWNWSACFSPPGSEIVSSSYRCEAALRCLLLCRHWTEGLLKLLWIWISVLTCPLKDLYNVKAALSHFCSLGVRKKAKYCLWMWDSMFLRVDLSEQPFDSVSGGVKLMLLNIAAICLGLGFLLIYIFSFWCDLKLLSQYSHGNITDRASARFDVATLATWVTFCLFFVSVCCHWHRSVSALASVERLICLTWSQLDFFFFFNLALGTSKVTCCWSLKFHTLQFATFCQQILMQTSHVFVKCDCTSLHTNLNYWTASSWLG